MVSGDCGDIAVGGNSHKLSSICERKVARLTIKEPAYIQDVLVHTMAIFHLSFGIPQYARLQQVMFFISFFIKKEWIYHS